MGRSRAARARLALRFLLRSLDLRAVGFGLALLAVTVGAAVTTTTLSLRADLGSKMTRELRAYGPNLLVRPPLDGGGRTLEEDWADRIARVPGPDRTVSPLLLVGGTAGGRPAVLVGMRFDAARALGSAWQIEGAWPEGDGGCLVGASVADALGLAPGARLRLEPAGGGGGELRVAGIARTGEAEDAQVMVPLGWLQEEAGLPGVVSLVALSVAGGPEEVASFAAGVQAGAPFPVEALPLLQISRAQGALLGKLDRMMLSLTGVVLLLAAMCAMTTLMSIVVERGAEIGLLRSMGASDGEVLRMLLGEATLLGTLGGGMGVGAGWAAAHWIGLQIFGTAVSLRPPVIPWVLGITLALSWLAVLLPLRRALRIQPAAALGGR